MILQALHYAKLLFLGVCLLIVLGFVYTVLAIIVFIALTISGIAVVYSLIAAAPNNRLRPRKKTKRLISVDANRSAN